MPPPHSLISSFQASETALLRKFPFLQVFGRRMLVALAAAATAYHIAAKPAARAGRMLMSSEWAGDLSAEVETAVAAVQRAMQLWCVVAVPRACSACCARAMHMQCTCGARAMHVRCTCGAHVMHMRCARATCATCAAACALHVSSPPSGAPERPHGPASRSWTDCRIPLPPPSAATH